MKTETVKIKELANDPANVRKHDERNLDAIKASLQRFGQQKPIVVDSKGIVVAGNGTLLAAKSLGWKDIEIVRTELEGANAIAYAVADNRTSELAVWDDDALARTLEALKNDDSIEQLVTGFTDQEIEDLIGRTIGLDDIEQDEIPEPPSDPITQVGDLWILGEHRLLCGDATSEADVERLMDGEKVDLCFTSPPYNLGKSATLNGNKTTRSKGTPYLTFDDGGNEQQWLELVENMKNTSRKFCSVVVFNVQPLAGNKRVIWKWIGDLSDCLVDVLVWDKQHAAPAMASGVVSSSYELLVVVGKDGASRSFPLSSWRGTIQSIYSAPRQTQNEFASIHGATFPVHLPAFIIGELCNRSKSAYDCCMGTGTTLIACEQLGRKCYGMEIDPAYCDVIVKRWENLTGEKAQCESVASTK